MRVLEKTVMAMVVGGAPDDYRPYARAAEDFGGLGSMGDIGWTGAYEGLGASGTGYDISATGSGHTGGGVMVIDNTPPVVASTDLGFGEHTWVEPGPLSEDHKTFDTALTVAAGGRAGIAASAFADGVAGAEAGSAAGPWGIAAGIAVGLLVGIGTNKALGIDHDHGHFVSPGEPGAKIP